MCIVLIKLIFYFLVNFGVNKPKLKVRTKKRENNNKNIINGKMYQSKNKAYSIGTKIYLSLDYISTL